MRKTICLLAAALLQGAAMASGIVMEIQGRVTVSSGATSAPASNGSVVEPGQTLRTGDGAEATLKLPGQNFVNLASATEIRVATESRIELLSGRVGVEADASSPDGFQLSLAAGSDAILPSMVAAFELDAAGREVRVLSGDVDVVNGQLVRHAAEGQALRLGEDSRPTTFRMSSSRAEAPYQNAYSRPDRKAAGDNYRLASYAMGDDGYDDRDDDFDDGASDMTGRWVPYSYGYGFAYYSAINPWWYSSSCYWPSASYGWDWWWDPYYRYSAWCGGWWWDPYYYCHSWYRHRSCHDHGWYRHHRQDDPRDHATSRLMSRTASHDARASLSPSRTGRSRARASVTSQPPSRMASSTRPPSHRESPPLVFRHSTERYAPSPYAGGFHRTAPSRPSPAPSYHTAPSHHPSPTHAATSAPRSAPSHAPSSHRGSASR
ncbi:MAG: FecR domain-containing protein [Acidobacteriota bacterium]